MPPSSSSEHRFDQCQIARAAQPGDQCHSGQTRLRGKDLDVGEQHGPQPVAPLADRVEVDLGEQFVQDGGVQFGGVADVDVQGHGAGVEFLGQAAHGHPVEPLGPQQSDRGGHDPAPGQGRLGRAFPAAHRSCRHATTVTYTYATYKYVAMSGRDAQRRRSRNTSQRMLAYM